MLFEWNTYQTKHGEDAGNTTLPSGHVVKYLVSNVDSIKGSLFAIMYYPDGKYNFLIFEQFADVEEIEEALIINHPKLFRFN